MAIQIITDSGSDLPKELIEEYNIKVVPLNVTFGSKTYKSGIDIDNETFYNKMKNTEELPKSASPSPQDFIEVYKEVDTSNEIIVLALSGALSSTYDSAVMAKNILLEEEPTRKIEVINTKTGSCGQILLINDALQLIKDGLPFEEIVEKTKANIKRTKTLIFLETLENVVKGGRLSRTKASIANVLNIKILLEVSESGSIEVLDKVRGNSRALKRFIDYISEYGKSLEGKVLTITHSNCEEKAKKILKEITDVYPFQKTILSEIGPLIGTYAGEGGIVISFYRD